MSEQIAAPAVTLPRNDFVKVRGASLRAVYIIWKRDVIRYVRDRMRLVTMLVQPVLFLVIFGTGLSASLRGAGGGVGTSEASLQYVQFIYPGVMGMAVLFSAVFGAMSIVWDREFGFLKEVLVAPIHRSAVAVGKSLGSVTQATAQGIIILVLAPIAGVALTPLGVLELVPLLVVLAFALASLGVAIASRMRSMQAFQVVTNFLMMPLFFLGGSLFPLGNGLPAWLTVLTRLDPVSYGIDAMRRTVLGAAGVPSRVLNQLSLTLFGHILSRWIEVLILLGFGVAMLGLAIRGFRQQD